MTEDTLESLYNKVDRLIYLCEQLKADNEALQLRQQMWEDERKRLLEKNEVARSRVESMITHLKSLKEGV